MLWVEMNTDRPYRRKPVLKDAPLMQRYPRVFVIGAIITGVSIFYSRFIYAFIIAKPPEEKSIASNGSRSAK